MPFTTSADGLELSYDLVGSGPAIMFPFGRAFRAMAPGGYYDAYIDLLGKDHTIVLADARGVGESERPPSLSGYTTELVIDDLLRVADAAGAETFGVWGYSFTAVLALLLALRSDRVTAVAFGGMALLDGPLAAMQDTTRALRDASTPDFPLYGAQCAYAGVLAGLDAWPSDEAVAALRCRGLAYWGSQDAFEVAGNHVDFAATNRARRRDIEAMGWQTKEFDGADHQLVQQPEVLGSLLAGFFNEAT